MNTWVLIALIICGTALIGFIGYLIVGAIFVNKIHKTQNKMLDKFDEF